MPEELRETIKRYNSPSYRQHILNNIIYNILHDELLSHEGKRKIYYQIMAAYYSVDHTNSNYAEELEERELVKCVEAAFVEAMKQRELSDHEKEQIIRDRFIRKTRYEQPPIIFTNEDWSALFK